VDVSNPTNCVRVGGINTFGIAHGVAVSGNYAYVADGSAGMRVVRVSDPANCIDVGGYSVGAEFHCVALAGNYAYVAGRYSSFSVIDVSNPSACRRVGGHYVPGFSRGIAVAGNYAYVASDLDGLVVIDVSQPTNCILVGKYKTPSSGVAITSRGIFASETSAGFLLLPSLTNAHLTLRIDATPGEPFTLEASTNLSASNPWTPLLTTNVPAMPFDFVDFDVKVTEKPQKFYRVSQP
jgi:hypothetical protein